MTNLDSICYRETIERKIQSHIRVIQVLLYLSVAIFTFLGTMWGFPMLVLSLGTLFFSWYFMGLARVSYEYRLDGAMLTVLRHSGTRTRPRTEDFLHMDLKKLVILADEGVDILDEAEAASKAATPRRITYDVSAHDPDRGCAVAYCMGTGPEEGRWLKVYMQVTPGLLSYLNMICRDKVHIYVEGE